MKVIISEQQFRDIIREEFDATFDDEKNPYEMIEKWAYSVIDYLYNEGVCAYDDANIHAMATGKKPVDYKDIIKVILSEYTTDCDCEAGQILRNYYKLSKKYDEKIVEVEDSINSAIKKFAEDANCELFI